MKFSTAILTLVLIAAAGAASASACDDDITRATAYTVDRSWVDGHYERDGRCVDWVPGHWVETRVPTVTVSVRDNDQRREWRDDRGHENWRDRGTSDRGHHATVIAPVVIPIPLPLPLPFPFPHHR